MTLRIDTSYQLEETTIVGQTQHFLLESKK
jgi:hypothetical protein